MSHHPKMRYSTAIEILRRGAQGDDVDTIRQHMHVSMGSVRTLLGKAGWPDLDAVAAYLQTYRSEEGREVWSAAETVASYAGSIRVNEKWVHAATAKLDHQELRALLAVAVAMLPEDVSPREALAWIDDQGRADGDVA